LNVARTSATFTATRVKAKFDRIFSYTDQTIPRVCTPNVDINAIYLQACEATKKLLDVLAVAKLPSVRALLLEAGLEGAVVHMWCI